MAAKTALLAIALLFTQPLLAEDNKGDFIRLVDALDEPEFYCLDLAGWGDHLQLDDPMQTHTCKTRGGNDQMFHFDDGKLKVSLYDRCVQVAGSSGITLAGSAVLVRPCSDSPLQKISLGDDGKIHLDDSSFCLAAGSDSAEASGPSHMWRTLVVAECDAATENLLAWQVGLD